MFKFILVGLMLASLSLPEYAYGFSASKEMSPCLPCLSHLSKWCKKTRKRIVRYIDPPIDIESFAKRSRPEWSELTTSRAYQPTEKPEKKDIPSLINPHNTLAVLAVAAGAYAFILWLNKPCNEQATPAVQPAEEGEQAAPEVQSMHNDEQEQPTIESAQQQKKSRPSSYFWDDLLFYCFLLGYML